MHELKNRQRRHTYKARNNQDDKDAVSQLICARLMAHPAYQHAKTVMWYSHCRSEVRTQAVLSDEVAAGQRIIVMPYCTEDEQGQAQLGLWRLDDMTELVPGMWGILEPPKSRWGGPGKAVVAEQIDCIIVPGVAFDRNGGRLGNGAGYYDRLLNCVRADAVLLGVCFEAQLLEQVVMDAHDVAMDAVITEHALYAGKGRQFFR